MLWPEQFLTVYFISLSFQLLDWVMERNNGQPKCVFVAYYGCACACARVYICMLESPFTWRDSGCLSLPVVKSFMGVNICFFTRATASKTPERQSWMAFSIGRQSFWSSCKKGHHKTKSFVAKGLLLQAYWLYCIMHVACCTFATHTQRANRTSVLLLWASASMSILMQFDK